LKIPNTKKAGRMAQAVEHLSSKCEAQSSNPNATKKKKKEEEKKKKQGYKIVIPLIFH
jgi:hypothetical protein